jgi:hypothetical protein
MSDDTRGPRTGSTGDGGPATQALPVTAARESAVGKDSAPKGGTASGGRSADRGTARDTQRQADGTGATAAAAAAAGAARTSGDRRPTVPRPAATRVEGRSAPARGPRARRARLALRRIDPWSVFLFSFLGSLCLGVVLLVAVAALFAILSGLGVVGSINEVFSEVTGGGPDSAPGAPLITAGRALGAAGVLALINVVLLTALATLGALLYNLCASLTGGIEVTLAEKD